MKHVTRRGVTLTDLLVLLAILAYMVALLLQHGAGASAQSCRTRCQSNLSQIGKALLLYSTDAMNKGAYPRGRADPRTDTLQVPSSTEGAPFPNNSLPGGNVFADSTPVNDVGIAIFLMLKYGEMSTEVFVCPSSAQEKDRLAGQSLAQRTSFSSNANLSYSFTNPYPNSDAINRGYQWSGNVQNAEFAIAADRNDGGGDPSKVMSNSPPSLHRTLSSANHEREGQNVLYADGHAEWQANSFVGAKWDCIFAPAAVLPSDPANAHSWRQKDPAQAEVYGTMQPQMGLDSVLVPWAGGGFPVGPTEFPVRGDNTLLYCLIGIVFVTGVVLVFMRIRQKRCASAQPH